MTDLVTPAQIAGMARVTEKHMRRVIRQFSRPLFCGGRKAWRGASLSIHDGLLVEFASLPADLRDAALVARDQLSLPFPPEHDILERRNPGPAPDQPMPKG